MTSISQKIAPWLLRSKVTPPRLLMSIVERKDLINTLNNGSKGSLVLLEAPGGYGKTCVLTEWREKCRMQDEAVCWLSIDEDDDVETFITYLAFAAHHAGVEVSSSGLLNFEFSTERSPIQCIHQYLAHIEKHDAKVSIVLDDYERLNENVKSILMPTLLRRLPENATLIVASREPVELNTSEFDHRGLVTKIGSRELKFSPNEMEQLWSSRLTKLQIAKLGNQTEGWPVLIRMLLSASSLGAFDIRHIDEVGQNDNSITTYFEQKILSRLDADVLDFLYSASIFEVITDDVLAEVIELNDGADFLIRLDSLEAFVVPLSDGVVGYRLHHMMREYLRHKLRDTDPEKHKALQRRAASWYSNVGNHVRAVRHAVRCEDLNFVTTILGATGGLALWLKEGLIEFRAIDKFLDEGTVLRSPTASLMRVIILMKSGKQSQASKLFDAASARHSESIQVDEILAASAIVCQIMIATYQGKSISEAKILELSRIADNLPEMGSQFASFILTIQCVTAHQSGNLTEALGFAEQAINMFRSINSLYGEYYIHLHLAMIYGLISDENDVEIEFKHAAKIMRRELSYDDGIKHIYGVLKFERDHEKSPNDLRNVQRVQSTSTKLLKGEGWIDIYAAAVRTLTEKRMLAGEVKEALLVLNTFKEFSERNDLVYLRDICLAQKSLIHSWSGQSSKALEFFNDLAHVQRDRSSYLARAPWRASEAIGEAELTLFAREFLAVNEESLQDWTRFRDEHHKYDNRRVTCRLGALLALCAPKEGQAVELSLLNKRLNNQFLRSILFVADKLRTVLAENSTPNQYNQLVNLLQMLDVADNETILSKEVSSFLSEKEFTVLKELSKGQSDKQIAQSVGVTEHGVRYHLKNIYSKLGAKNRTEALIKVRSLGVDI